MKNNNKSSFFLYKIAIPVIIGILVVCYMLSKDINNIDFSAITLNEYSILGFILVLLVIFGRELGYIIRYHILSDNDLSIKQSFRVTMLCEFSSCITPSSVGGSGLAMIFMKREGIRAGRGTAIVLITLFLDELFFVVSSPIAFLFFSSSEIFGSVSKEFSTGIQWSFWTVYALITIWTIILYIGIFHKPHYIKNTLNYIFKIHFLSKWGNVVSSFGNDLVSASNDVKTHNCLWWIKGFGATALSWCSRYLLVNAIFIALIGFDSQWLIFAKQSVVWLILLVTPTPGGAGVSEWLFTSYYADLLQTYGVSLIIALIWRVFSYYVYIILGLSVIPSWLRKKNGNLAKE